MQTSITEFSNFDHVALAQKLEKVILFFPLALVRENEKQSKLTSEKTVEHLLHSTSSLNSVAWLGLYTLRRNGLPRRSNC